MTTKERKKIHSGEFIASHMLFITKNYPREILAIASASGTHLYDIETCKKILHIKQEVMQSGFDTKREIFYTGRLSLFSLKMIDLQNRIDQEDQEYKEHI